MISAHRALRLSIVLGLLLSLQTLRLGFLLDDLKLVAQAEGVFPQTRPFDSFSFARDPAELKLLVERGPMPWWTLPNLRMAFFRPLSSALISFDSAVFHRAAWAFHLHSVLWFLALILAVGAFYRRTLCAGAGAIALIIFTLDDVHWIPVAWLANRNALVAAVPAVLALVAHLRWREDGWKRGRILGPVGLVIALTGGESALAFVAYFVAWELFASGPVRDRLLALVPVIAVVAGWAVAYRWLGYGAYGSDTYVDPGKNPLEFLAVAPPRLLVLVGSLTLKLSSDLSFVIPASMPALCAAGLLGVVGVTLVARRFWPDLAERERTAIKWLSLGAVCSLVPALATFPADRLLLPASLGSMGVLAILFRAAWNRRTRGSRALVVWLTITTVIVPIPIWIGAPMVLEGFGQRGKTAILEAPPAHFDRRVVLLNAGDIGAALYGPLFLQAAGRPFPDRWWILTMDAHPHRLRRVGEQALELEVLGGRLLETWYERLVRGERFPIETGHTVELSGARITVLASEGGKPTRIRLDLERPMSEHRLLSWKAGALIEVQPPLEGESIALEAQPDLLQAQLK